MFFLFHVKHGSGRIRGILCDGSIVLSGKKKGLARKEFHCGIDGGSQKQQSDQPEYNKMSDSLFQPQDLFLRRRGLSPPGMNLFGNGGILPVGKLNGNPRFYRISAHFLQAEAAESLIFRNFPSAFHAVHDHTSHFDCPYCTTLFPVRKEGFFFKQKETFIKCL